jgi:hypothetical protein
MECRIALLILHEQRLCGSFGIPVDWAIGAFDPSTFRDRYEEALRRGEDQ